MKDIYTRTNDVVQAKIKRKGVAKAKFALVPGGSGLPPKKLAPKGTAAAAAQGMVRLRPIAKMSNKTDYRSACKDVMDNPGDYRGDPTNLDRYEMEPYHYNSIGPYHMMGSGETHAGYNTGMGREKGMRFYREKKHPKQKVHVDQGRLMAWADWVYSTPHMKT